jgi:hypothetical protein
MTLRASRWVRFLVPLVLVLLSASAAHAQKVPEIVLWSAGASLLAPVFAVPAKLGILRLLALQASAARLWSICAIEWVLWFPIAFVLLRTGRSSFAPLTLLVIMASVVWLHRAGVANASWRSALLLSLATPILALALPFLAFAFAVLLESLGV